MRHLECGWLKFENGQIFHATSRLHLGMRTSLIFNTQHVAARRNRVAPNNVAICCVHKLEWLTGLVNAGTTMLGYMC